MKKILAFSGSSSSKSINQKLVHAAVAHLDPEAVTVIDIRDYPLPIHSVDIEAQGMPENAVRLRALFSEHDGFLISCPENNSSITAILKNLLDWMSRFEGKIFQQKPVLWMSAAPGKNGGKTNLKHLAELTPWWGGELAATFSLPHFHDSFDVDAGVLREVEHRAELAAAVKALEAAVSK
ncbi:NADPH-dependent FMN reductase [Denitrobaculum tricleocarpae]|uniref:NAD(P)H-dependent oxidoreductase n=1 Tax=Denitrobaculum tricleocarpae TaxID=2591009 RepID=A0A545TPB9_9PROT|nr:NADPH-dependent FMN reductase [Denitrobaculum tricleocarpae]TQV79069.1 NAD(P)H-dependent oxidoreductase [Denitrobaculum tricleocarpae]